MALETLVYESSGVLGDLLQVGDVYRIFKFSDAGLPAGDYRVIAKENAGDRWRLLLMRLDERVQGKR